MSDWDEIKRLAADFQRAQLSDTVQCLSERNCVEIVQRLMDMKLIDILYTVDGKEYITHEELTKEIHEELIVHGGRVNSVDIAHVLNVDLGHVETKIADIVRHERDIQVVLGQLVNKCYVDSMCEEINDRLN